MGSARTALLLTMSYHRGSILSRCRVFSLLGVSGALPLSTDLALSILNIPMELQREGIHTPLV